MRFFMYFVAILLAASCQSLLERVSAGERPSVGFRYLDLLYSDSFDETGDWRTYERDDLSMTVAAGSYRISLAARQYVWTQLPTLYEDIVLEAEVRQLSDFEHNAFGIACRLDPANSGRGYYFLIGGDGYYSIRWSNGRSLDEIVRARQSSAIKRGASRNRIKALCLGDYLALWVNGHFVAEARDSRANAGAAGLAAVMNYRGKTLSVAFDELKIWRSALEPAR